MSNKIKIGIGWPNEVTKDQLEISYYKGSGSGGQKKNKTSSGVRIKHIPTGMVAQCDENREQSKNKQVAFKKLCDELIPIMRNEARKQRYSAGLDRIRTYKEKEDLVIDERIKNKVFSYKEILDGDLDALLEELLSIHEKKFLF